MLIISALSEPVHHEPVSVEWAPSERCSWGFLTKRIDKKTQQPTATAMMSIFDGISMALQSHYLVCIHLGTTSPAHGQIELSLYYSE